MPNKQRLLLPRTNIVGKEPIPSEMLYGELYVNYASGDGTSFLVTKKDGGTIGRFSEDNSFSSTLEIRGGGE